MQKRSHILRLVFVRALACATCLASVESPLLAADRAPMVFHRGNLAEPDSLDPAIIASYPEHNIVGEIFMGLTTEDAESHVIPGMAESWSASEDGIVWTFKLRAGLKWSDGTPLRASDFVFGFRRLLDPKTAAKYASVEYVIKNAEEVNTGKAPLDQLGVRAVDDRTVEITLAQQAPFLPALMRHSTAYPIPEHALKKYGDAWVKPGNLVSNGPYVAAEWRPNEYVKLVKNPQFFDAANVKIDEVYFYPIQDESSALARFRAGELDANIGAIGFPSSQKEWLEKNMPGQALTTPMLGVDYLVLNIRKPPFDDVRARRAVALCLDSKTLIDKVTRDGRVPAFAFVPPGIANYNGRAHFDFADWQMERRRAEAKELLARAGFTPDRPLSFSYKYMISKDGRRSAIGTAALLKECGIVARPVGNEFRIHYAGLQSGDFEIATAAWGADYNDPQNFLYLIDSRSGVFNYAGYKNAAFDRLMDEAKATLDLEKRAELMSQAEQIALNDVGVLPVAFKTTRELVAPYVKGFVPNAEDFHRTRFMWIEPH